MIETATEAPTTTDSPRLAAFREQVEAKQAALMTAQETLAAKMREIEVARLAQSQRATKLAELAAQAQAAAAASIRGGDGSIGGEELEADFLRYRVEKETVSAAQALAQLEAELTPLQQATQAASQELAQAQALLEREEIAIQAEALRAEWEAFCAAGEALAARSRALNKRASGRNIVVPGEQVAHIRGASEHTQARVGIRVSVAPDLARPDVRTQTVLGGLIGGGAAW